MKSIFTPGIPPLLQRREEPVHVLLDRQPRQPKYDLHVALPAVGDQLLQIEVGIGWKTSVVEADQPSSMMM